MLGIKIGWVCDLDRAWERCLPRYSFTRLDGRAPAAGYNFRYGTATAAAGHTCRSRGHSAARSHCPTSLCRHARYYRWQDGTERRTLTKAFGIRFDVLVYGNVRGGLGGPCGAMAGGTPRQRGSLHPQAGKFGIVPTLINTVAAFTSIGVVSCGRSQPLRGGIPQRGSVPPTPMLPPPGHGAVRHHPAQLPEGS